MIYNSAFRSLASIAVVTIGMSSRAPCTTPVGYYSQELSAGPNLIAPALSPPTLSATYDPVTDRYTYVYAAFPLKNFINPGSVPLQTTVSLWDPGTLSWSTPSVMTASGWTIDYPMALGVGIMVNAPESFIFTSAGEVRAGPAGYSELWSPQGADYRGFYEGDGAQWYDADQPFGTGYYLLGSGWPVVNPPDWPPLGFVDLFGRSPRPGEEIVTRDNHYTYMSNGFWSGADYYSNDSPTLDVGEAAFFNLGPVAVPEPATGLLFGLLTLALLSGRRRG